MHMHKTHTYTHDIRNKETHQCTNKGTEEDCYIDVNNAGFRIFLKTEALPMVSKEVNTSVMFVRPQGYTLCVPEKKLNVNRNFVC